MTITVLVSNIDQYMSQDLIDSDISTLAAFAEHVTADIVTACEIMSDASNAALAANFAQRGYRVFGNGPAPKENPVAIHNDWTVTGHRVRLLTRGVAKLTPNRYVTEVDLQNGPVVLATHLVSEAQKPTATQRALRLVLFRVEKKRIRKIIARWTRQGREVVVCGDMNAPAHRIDWRQIHRRRLDVQTDLTPFQGTPLGKMMVATVVHPRTKPITVLKTGNKPATTLHTDHPFRWGSYC